MSIMNIGKIRGFTPIFDGIADTLGIKCAIVFGIIWRCTDEDGVWEVTMDKLAEMANLPKAEVSRYLRNIINMGYLGDATLNDSEVKRLVDTGKAGMRVTIRASADMGVEAHE